MTTCECGHDRTDHDMWGSGPCVAGCACKAFREAGPPAAPERCLFCGTEVTPGKLIGNTLANGAMPKMAEIAAKALRMHTDETDQLRQSAALRGQENDALRALVEELRAGRAADLETYRESERELIAECDRLRARVSELEERCEQARGRIAKLEAGLAAALEEWVRGGWEYERLARLLPGNSAGNSPRGDDPNAT